MAVSWRRGHRPSLCTELWQSVQVAIEGGGGGGEEGEEEEGGKEGGGWLVKSLFKEDSYEVLVTDLCGVWGESLEGSGVNRRSKALNPSVEAPLSVVLSRLSSLLHSSTSPSFTLTFSTDSLTLSLSTSLSGLPFQWEFHCTKEDNTVLSSHIISPLLSMVAEFSRRQQELVTLLTRKDKEIQDYKDGGAQVSRRHLQTVPFDEKAFANEMTLSCEFESTAQSPLEVFGLPSCQDLYRNIAMIRQWSKNRDGLPSDVTPTESATTGTWSTKIPSSLLPPYSSPTPSPHTSPSKSPLKRPTMADSPPKEDELSRREILERKLEEEKLKQGKKKRKKLL